MTWSWDPTLYAGAATHYVRGRAAYPAALAEALVDVLGLDGSQSLLDVGCGPGSLTLLLAPHVATVTGVDPDEGMLAEAARRLPTARFVRARAEELPAGLGSSDVITLAQSFHWMDRPRVAAILAGMLTARGALVHVSATTHQGDGDVPWPAIEALVADHLGPGRRAGQGRLTGPVAGEAETSAYESACFRAAGLELAARRHTAPWRVTRTADEVVDGVLSLSYAAPHLFGAGLDAFVAELRDRLGPGPFTETMRGIRIDVWRP